MAYGSRYRRYGRRTNRKRFGARRVGGRRMYKGGRRLQMNPNNYMSMGIGAAAVLDSVRRNWPNRGRDFRPIKTKQSLYQEATTKTDNISASSYSWGKAKPAPWMSTLLKGLQGRATGSEVSSTAISSSTGKQNMVFYGTLTKVNLDAIKLAANDTVSTANEVSFFIDYAKRRNVYRNQSNSSAKLVLYDLVSRRLVANTAVDSPIEGWKKGLDDLGILDHHLDVGVTPFRSPEFNRYWKVKKVTVVNMEPGQQHEHVVYHRINRIVKSTEFDNFGSVYAIPGLTSVTLAVFHGCLGHEELVTTNVSYMPVRMDVVCHMEYRYGFLTKSSPQYSWLNNLPAVTDFDFMGEDDVEKSPVNA